MSHCASHEAVALHAGTHAPFGGDTVWVSQAAAWETLPDELKDLLVGRDAIHVGKPYGVKWAPPIEERSGASIKMTRGDPEADTERAHPAVIRNRSPADWRCSSIRFM